ncbi:MAG: RidA family protein [Hyphomicrobiales bacterium]|jgi:enamine deaminase RidA (YjgF/YER057c/UK114 family)|nr:RidA family protein [Hyphomicrobiales bacterium]
MSGRIEAQLKSHGVSLPQASAPAANYVPFVLSGNLLFIAGQLPVEDGMIAHTGKLGGGVSLSDGQAAARLCAVNILAQVKAATGDLDKVVRCVKLGGFVNCTADFGDQPKVMNGASDLMVLAFGETGRHARFAVGAPSLPFDAAVEVDAIFEIA